MSKEDKVYLAVIAVGTILIATIIYAVSGPSKSMINDLEFRHTKNSSNEVSDMRKEQEGNDLKRIYDDAPEKREMNYNERTSGGNKEKISQEPDAVALESLLDGLGWAGVTVTEGVKERTATGWRLELEVIAETDYYVIMETNESMTNGRIVSKSTDSPW